MTDITLSDLLRIVDEGWVFDAQNYPKLPDAKHQPTDAVLFALRHLLEHWGKAFGRLCTVLEPLEHGKELSEAGRKELHTVVIKFLTPALRAAGLLDMSADIVLMRVTAELAANNQKPD